MDSIAGIPRSIGSLREPMEPVTLLGAVLLVVSACLLRPFGDLEILSNVVPFLGGASVMCLGFLLTLRTRSIGPLWFWLVAVGVRIVLSGMQPGNDIFRYIWEGEVQNAGYSPYCLAPDSQALSPLRDSFWSLVKHKQVSAIYPPLAELAFRAVTAVSASVLAMKLVFIAADLAICWLVFHRYGGSLALGYAWNPLVLYSFAGGGHYDSLFILAVTGAFHLWDSKASPSNRLACVTLLGAGVALKWLCLPVLGWALWKTWRLDGLKRFFLAMCASTVPFGFAWSIVALAQWSCPLVPADFTRVARSAEALPALVEWLLPSNHLLNKNSSYLAIFGLLSVVLLWRQNSIQRAGHSVMSAALLTTPMFHAWYGTWIMPLLLEERSRGSIALSLSAFVYFWLHHTAGQPGGIWHQSWWEKVLLWGPFIAGLLWDHRTRRRGGPRRDDSDGSRTDCVVT
ncbi:MAG: hypothetical protein HY820_26840 [Acidobacteria bacterium]|nr:hypothetical protein [Acidobacteriota bacterium]